MSVYIVATVHRTDYEDFILRLELSIRASTLPCVVAGDFNAKSQFWGSPKEDVRGTILVDMMSALDLHVCNDGSPTFVRGQSLSHIDITLVSRPIAGRVSKWKVLDSESLSLHKYISFTLKSMLPWRPAENREQAGWSTRSLNKELPRWPQYTPRRANRSFQQNKKLSLWCPG